jgi:hypothetical protein
MQSSGEKPGVTPASVFNSDLKVSSLYNTGKLQIKVDKIPTWSGSWMLLDALFPVEKDLLARPWRMLWMRGEKVCPSAMPTSYPCLMTHKVQGDATYLSLKITAN